METHLVDVADHLVSSIRAQMHDITEKQSGFELIPGERG